MRALHFIKDSYTAIYKYYTQPRNREETIYDHFTREERLRYAEMMEKRAATADLGDLYYQEHPNRQDDDPNFPKKFYRELNPLEQLTIQERNKFRIVDHKTNMKKAGKTQEGYQLYSSRESNLVKAKQSNFQRVRLYAF